MIQTLLGLPAGGPKMPETNAALIKRPGVARHERWLLHRPHGQCRTWQRNQSRWRERLTTFVVVLTGEPFRESVGDAPDV
jgi:hypothetical protein